MDSGQELPCLLTSSQKGWSSFKSFVPEFGISCVSHYTMNLGQLWKHHINEARNTFYGVGPNEDSNAESSITPILNTQPDLIKNFNTLNYEGSQSKIDEFTTDPITNLLQTVNIITYTERKVGTWKKYTRTSKTER